MENLNENIFKKIKEFLKKHFIKHDGKEKIKNKQLKENVDNSLMTDITMTDTNIADKLRNFGLTYLADVANINKYSVQRMISGLKNNIGAAEFLLHYYEGDKEFEIYDIAYTGIYSISTNYNDFKTILQKSEECDRLIIECCRKLESKKLLQGDFINFKDVSSVVSPYYAKIYRVYKSIATDRSEATLNSLYQTRLNMGILEKQNKSLKEELVENYNMYLECFQVSDSSESREKFISMIDRISESDLIIETLIEYLDEMSTLNEEEMKNAEKFYLKWRNKINKKISSSGRLSPKEMAFALGLCASAEVTLIGGILAGLCLPVLSLPIAAAGIGQLIVGTSKVKEEYDTRQVDTGLVTSTIAHAIKHTDKYKELYEISKKFNSCLEKFKTNPTEEGKVAIKTAYKEFKKAFHNSGIHKDFREAFRSAMFDARASGKRGITMYDILDKMGSKQTGVDVDGHRIRLMSNERHVDELVKELINARLKNDSKSGIKTFLINELDDCKFDYKYIILSKDRQTILGTVVSIKSSRFDYTLEVARTGNPVFSLRWTKDVDWDTVKIRHAEAIKDIKEKYKNNYTIIREKSEWIKK